MINLLSPIDKHQLRAARKNVVLLRYNIVTLASILIIGIIYAGGFFVTTQGKMAAEAQLAEDSARTRDYGAVRTKIQQFSKNLTTAKLILSNEVAYSTLITDIAKIMPSGTILTNLTLKPDDFGKATSLSAGATNYGRALELKSALEKSALFSDVSLENIGSAGAESPASRGYPITVSLKATFATAAEIKALHEKEAAQ